MALNLEVGKKYETRDGRRATVYAIDLVSEDGEVLVALRNMKSSKPSDKITAVHQGGTYRLPGSPPHDCDLVEEWIDPIYEYFPVWKKSHGPERFKDRDEAMSLGGKEATPDNPLVCLVRIDQDGQVTFDKQGSNIQPPEVEDE